MCLAPKMPPPPEPPAPPPESALQGKQPTTVKAPSSRETLRQASKGAAALTIPLSTGGMSAGAPNLSIGSK
jgi:hypothetical protein